MGSMATNYAATHHWKHIIYLLPLFLKLTFAQRDWEYDNEVEWGLTYPQCNGDRQSPIALEKNNCKKIPLNDYIHVEMLGYNRIADANFTNTGHTVNMVFNYIGDDTPHTIVTENGVTSIYNFRSLHFHWPAEHMIEGLRFYMEMHLVHMNPENQKLLVLGFGFRMCSKSTSGMDVIARAVGLLKEPGDLVDISQFSPGRAMPRNKNVCGFFKYNGSLTTPPCTENVTWLVRREPLCLESWQMQNFYMVRNDEGLPMIGNARSLQETNDRTVQFIECRRQHY